jgi:cell division protein FtsB
MKRAFILSAIFILLMRLPAAAQDAAGTATNAPPSPPVVTAATIAAKEDAEERYQRLAADLLAVQSDNETLHAKVTALEQEVESLRDAQAHFADTSGMQDELKHLADAIQEVDKKRLADKDAISEEIRKSIEGLEHSLGSAPTPSHISATKPAVSTDSPAVENGFSYTIHDGDRLDLIVKAYNADFRSKGMKTITLRQAKEANPNVDWNRLRVGQKIVIPRPSAD